LGQHISKQSEDYFYELGTGNYPGNSHCNPDELLESPEKIKSFQSAIESRGLTISGLSCYGNPFHPNKNVAKEAHDVWRKTVLLAERLEVPVINSLSGCPGDHPGAKFPNWVHCSWPPEYSEVLDWQWNNVVIPYWKEEAKYAEKHGIHQIDSKVLDRSWTFRSVGYGHDEKMWKDIVSALRAVVYDYVLSIEHEDILASINEGLMKAVALLKGTLFKEQLTEMWWA
jgi:sugar phosphate isomerase/epimerase